MNRNLQTTRWLIPAALGLLFTAGVIQGRTAVQIQEPITETRRILGLMYPEGPAIEVLFRGTYRLPEASGKARVQRKKGTTEIDLQLSGLKPAAWFGGDYSTYVVWVASPEGHLDNVGEIILEGEKGELDDVSTTLETFGVMVTAEPHFLVDRPSRFVVLENSRPAKDVGLVKTATIPYRGFEGIYNSSSQSLAGNVVEVEGEFRPHVDSALASVELAERAGAARYAPERLELARRALEKTLEAAEMGVSSRNQMLLSHETVRLAVDAQKTASTAAVQAALDLEREAYSDEIDALEQAIASARNAADRVRLAAQRTELEASLEAAARRKAQQEAMEAARRAAEAEREARRAQADARDAQARLKEALGRVAEVRETARGLIVSLPDVLFEFDRADLRPGTREILAKMAGILQVVDSYFLSVEGHTDAIGGDLYNRELSRRRAESVRSYLIEQGISAAMIQARGLGETVPVASNDTADGRQKNRRVEVVVMEQQTYEVHMD